VGGKLRKRWALPESRVGGINKEPTKKGKGTPISTPQPHTGMYRKTLSTAKHRDKEYTESRWLPGCFTDPRVFPWVKKS